MKDYILAIDQGTTSSRSMIINRRGEVVAVAQMEFEQYFPQDGWVEHDPEEIWDTTLQTCRQAISSANIHVSEIVGIGITNQRETTVIWDRLTGRPVYNAIVWQDRRTADFCEQLKKSGHESVITEKTGLLIDPYFSATKVPWILDNVPGARESAENGELAFGTIDTFLLWRLTGGASHKTDATNASRTSLFDIKSQRWSDDLLRLFNVPKQLLPEVMDCSDEFGDTVKSLFGMSLPVYGIAGDQQSALIGQACFEPGMAKSTYGTGCFLILNTGTELVRSENRLLSTVGYRLNGKTCYAIEGSIFIAGAAIQWLRDGIRLISDASETLTHAEAVGVSNSVYLVPAFTGLGAPFWDPHARGAILGITRDTGIAEIVTAGLQSVCYQTKDLVRAMQNDGAMYSTFRVDGGMVVNDWVVQFLSDILNVPVDRPKVTETTALGVAYLVGLKAGWYKDLDEIAELWACEKRFEPTMNSETRKKLYDGWLDSVDRVKRS
ncbi:MAG: glycerol kinase [Proteobacteria bacterium]|nr:MAG: glycerol kinase [Pseudomonadota bacterium]PIE40216.1 MAG: glycerol kinase [Gammaproteobacteria bacterium]